MFFSYSDLPDEIKVYIHNSIANHVTEVTIIHMVASIWRINIKSNTVKVARTKYTDMILAEYNINPKGSFCEKLLEYFRLNTDISFLAVTH